MSSTSTTWSTQGNTKAGATSTSTDSLTTGTLTANTIQLANNVIKASDGDSTITLDTSDNVTIAGDLTISGGNITSALTLDSTLTVTNTTQLNNTLTVGVDDTGYDVKLFGATASNYMLWDASADKLIINSTDDNDCIQLISTEPEGVQGPTIIFERNSASPGDDDNLGACVFKGYNDADETITYAQLTSSSLDVSDGTECGALKLRVQVAGTGRNVIDINGVGSVGNVELGYGTTSSTKVKGYFAANNQTPAAAPDWTVSNKTGTPRSLDADSNIASIGDNLAQLVDDLIAIGILQ